MIRNFSASAVPAGAERPEPWARLPESRSEIILTNIDHTLIRNVTVVNALGLHARSAARIAALASEATHDVRVCRQGETADAKSVIDLLTMACTRGSVLTVEIVDPSDQDVLDRIVALFADGFGE